MATEEGDTMESFLVVVGLDDDSSTECQRRIVRVSLARPSSVSTVESTPTEIGLEAAACVICNTLYAVGIGSAFNELWKWNEASDWTRCADMTSGRRRHCVAVVDSTLYVLGGWVDPTTHEEEQVDGKALSIVEAYNAQTDEWSPAGQLLLAVDNAGCVAYKNSIYVFGGGDTDSKALADVQVYDAAQRTCSLLSSAMPRAYMLMRAVVWETYAILLGHETCFIYSFETETWQERALFRTGMINFGLVIDGSTLYMAGGGYPPSDKVRSMSVRDVIEDKQDVRWKHHARLPECAFVHAFCVIPLSRPSNTPVSAPSP